MLESHVVFPGLLERMVTDGEELLVLQVRLRASERLPRSGASDQGQRAGHHSRT